MSSNTPDKPTTDTTTEHTEVLTGHQPAPATEPTRPLPGALPDTRPDTRPAEARTQPRFSPDPPVAPEVVRGPYIAPVILGLVCLAVAALAFAQEIADWSIDWGNVGPLGIVVAGAVLVVLGAVGLLSSRRRRT